MHITSAHISLDKASPWPCLISKKVRKYNLTMRLQKEAWTIRKYPDAACTGIPASLTDGSLSFSKVLIKRGYTWFQKKLNYFLPAHKWLALKPWQDSMLILPRPRMGTGFASLLKPTMRKAIEFYVSRKIWSQIFQSYLGKCHLGHMNSFFYPLHFILSGLQVMG